MSRRFQYSLAAMLVATSMGLTFGQESDDAERPRVEKTLVPPPIPSPEAALEDAAQTRAKKAVLRELKARQKIEEALDQDTAIDVVETPFMDVIRDVAKAHDITIALDPAGLERVGVAGDQLVNLSLKEISLRAALRILLEPLNLAPIVRNEVLTITALDCSEAEATVRTFPIGGLLKRLEDPTELTTALELVLPDNMRIDRDRDCQPRFRVVANYLVVRGSPRHHLLAEQFLQGIILGKQPETESSRETVIQQADPRK